MNRKQYDRVIWREGMLISPQHLQQQELWEEQVLHERLAAASPLTWGVQAVEFDAGALKSGRLELTKFAGVMPEAPQYTASSLRNDSAICSRLQMTRTCPSCSWTSGVRPLGMRS